MSIKCRADDVDENLFRRLLDLGVTRAYVGRRVRLRSQFGARSIKRQPSRRISAALETLNRVGMLADFGLIFFDPDSTLEDVRANLGFFRTMAGDGQAPLSFGRMKCTPDTPMLDR